MHFRFDVPIRFLNRIRILGIRIYTLLTVQLRVRRKCTRNICKLKILLKCSYITILKKKSPISRHQPGKRNKMINQFGKSPIKTQRLK